MDNGTEFSIEVLSSGSIINPNNFLCDRNPTVSYRCLANCLLYRIKLDALEDIAVDYRDFYKEFIKHRAVANNNKSRDQ